MKTTKYKHFKLFNYGANILPFYFPDTYCSFLFNNNRSSILFNLHMGKQIYFSQERAK